MVCKLVFERTKSSESILEANGDRERDRGIFKAVWGESRGISCSSVGVDGDGDGDGVKIAGRKYMTPRLRLPRRRVRGRIAVEPMAEERSHVVARRNACTAIAPIEMRSPARPSDDAGDGDLTPREIGKRGRSPIGDEGMEENDDRGVVGSVVVPNDSDTVTKPKSRWNLPSRW